MRTLCLLFFCLAVGLPLGQQLAGRLGGKPLEQPEKSVASKLRSIIPQAAIQQVTQAAMPQDAQPGSFRRFRGSSSQRSDYPSWDLPTNFKKDVFTFVRIEFDSRGGFRRGGSGWSNDYPDCDWNFSVRLQQLTSLKVHPDGKILRLTDDELSDYPFIFMTNLGSMSLSDAEQKNLREYLFKGGFLMADDFWAAAEWQHIREVMKLVLPDRKPVELALDHPIFHTVYNLDALPQVPSIRAWERGMTYEDWHGPYENGDTSPHFWGYFDDHGRLMALFCHNNDIADGWEREGEEIEYFRQYSVKWSYPFGINLVSYAMSY